LDLFKERRHLVNVKKYVLYLGAEVGIADGLLVGTLVGRWEGTKTEANGSNIQQ